MDSVCALHGRRNCCLASPQFLEYMTSYSASQPALVSSDSSTSESSSNTIVSPPPAEPAPVQEKSGQLTPRPTSARPPSILIKARKSVDVPSPQPVLRRHSSPTAAPEPLRSPPSSPPPVPTSILNSPSNRSMTDSAVASTTRRPTLNFATDENAARRDAKAVNAVPQPPIYPRAKITKLPAKSITPATPSGTPASSARSRVMASTTDASKVTVTPRPKSSPPITHNPSAKPTSSLVVKSQGAKLMASRATPKVKLPNPTNHVHLSRKTETIPISFFAKLFSSKSTYKKRQSDISDIKDVFVIDPDLVLPRGMFRALDDSFVGLGRKDSFQYDDEELIGEEHQLYHGLALKRSRTFSGAGLDSRTNGSNASSAPGKDKKNLKLEVENGGIDVDVHLVPFLDLGSTPAKRTTIDLRLLPDDNFKPGNHPLVARIHASEKRAPFHLTARTYALPPPPPPPAALTNDTASPTPPGSTTPGSWTPVPSPQMKSSVLKHHRRAATNPTSINSVLCSTNHTHHAASLSTISLSSPSYNTPLSSSSSSKISSLLDKSDMEIQIPRSYRGPITIHVASGNLDEHILFSREVKERSVVLREGRFARGCFVGTQEFAGDEAEEEEEVEGGEEESEGREGGEKTGDGVCTVCGGNEGENGVEERKVVSPILDSAKNGGEMNGSDDLRPSSGGASSAPISPLKVVKRKPVKSFSSQNLENGSNSAVKEESPSSPPPPQSPPPQSSSPPPQTTTTTTNDRGSSPPPPTITTPNGILANRPSFLDTDPNVTSNHIDFNSNTGSGWKLTKNQDLNGRSRRVGSAEQHGMNVVPYRSSPLRFSLSASSPNLPMLEERRRESWGRKEGGSLLGHGEDASAGVGNLETSKGHGRGKKIVRLEELSSLPSSSSSEEEEEEGEEGEEENDGGGTGSGSVNYESAEDGSASASGHDELEEPSPNSNAENSQEQEQLPQQLPPQEQQQQQQQEPIRCLCNHQLQKRVPQNQGKCTTIRKRREWIGDRIDIMIGKGKVKIKYDDEIETNMKRNGRWFGR